MKNILIIFIVISTFGCKEKTDAFFDSLISSVKKSETSKESSDGLKKTTILIKNAKVYTVAGKTYEKANILIKDGLISSISEAEVKETNEMTVINGFGKQVTPGLIDVHSHMGVYPQPGFKAHSDGNEMTGKNTANVSAQDGFWPQDPALWRAVAGGITAIQVLPGSANLVGGTSFTARMVPGKVDPKDMRFPGAPVGMKMACGENPKRVYGAKGGPFTRMGNAAEFRKLFQAAKEYAAKNNDKSKKKKKDDKNEASSSKVDFVNENLAKVLSGEILLHIHCYRADDISVMINISKEYGFKIKTFQHALEAYKLSEKLKENDIGSATWADWWGFKAEAYDGIPHNIALLENAGAKAIVHSDSSTDVRFLNVEASKAMRSGRELGLKISEEQALSWVTKNAAWALGIDDKVGTLEVGKFADIAIWDGHPLSAYTKTSHVIVNGEVIFDRAKEIRPESDFELGFDLTKFNDGREFSKVKTTQKISIPEFNQDWFKKDFSNKDQSNSFVLANVVLSKNASMIKFIKIEEGVITQISDKPILESDLEVIDGKGALVTPGLIESSSSLGLFEISAEMGANDSYDGDVKMSPSLRSVDALNLDGPRIEINRKEGVTTAISSVSTSTLFGEAVAFDLLKESEEIDPSIYLASSFTKSNYPENYSSRAAIWRELRRVAKETFSGKFLETHLLQEEDYKTLKKYLNGAKPWLVSIDRSGDIKRLIKFKREIEKKYGAKPNFVILGGVESWKVASLLFKEKIPVIIKPTGQSPKSFETIYSRDDVSAYLTSKGVDVLITTSDWDSNVRRLRQQAGFSVKYGMKWSEALDSITSAPAKAFNLKNRGEIKEGALANLVLWTGDLFEPYHTAQAIWINGRRQSLMNRQRALALKYLPKTIDK